MFLKTRRIFFFFFLVFSFLFILTNSGLAQDARPEILLIQLNDVTINPVTAEFISEAIDQATQDKAISLIIELDTPGGLLTSTRSIVKKMMAAKIPIVVYIYPRGARAGSAGVFITYAAHIAAMAPSTNIGAAHPVQMGGGRQQKRSFWDALRDVLDSSRGNSQGRPTRKTSQENPMESKILNDSVAFIRAIAQERHRNAQWAEEAVVQSSSVTEAEALEKNIINIVAKDKSDLIDQMDGRKVSLNGRTIVLHTKNAVVRKLPMSLRQKILNILANPNISYFFLILGFYGLLYEVTHPGIGVPGVMGVIFLVLAFFSLQTLPTNYAGLALIILGIVLFIAEAMIPGFGLLTLGGLVCMVLGSLFLFNSPEPLMRVSLTMIIPFTAATAGITVFLVRLVVRSHTRRVLSGKEGLVGEKGVVQTDINLQRHGKVFIHGEIWNAAADEEIKKGEEITVLEVRGMLLKVKKTVD